MTNESQENQDGYGYSEHVPMEYNLNFGLNSGTATLKKFEWTSQGGKDGADMEALDIIFSIPGKDGKGKDISYRKFPINKAFYREDGQDLETEDPEHPAFKQEKSNLSAVLVHIIGCFVPKDEIKIALRTPVQKFRNYCEVLQGLLPSDYPTKKLDLFFNWQWKIKGDNTKTFMELPKNMKHGRWAAAHISPTGSWEKQLKQNPSDNETALRYVDKEGNIHPFVRTGWFMNSNFATQQKEEESAAGDTMNKGSKSEGSW